MKQAFLFTGENVYALEIEYRRWREEFARKHGVDNITVHDAKTQTIGMIIDELRSMPFLSTKRLMVLRGIPRLSADEMDELVDSLHEDCVLLFIEAKPDKRLGGIKRLLEKAKVQDFPALSGASLSRWINDRSSALGVRLTPCALKALVTHVGADQLALDTELQRMAAYDSADAVDERMVEQFTASIDEGIIWRVTDLLLIGKKEDALAAAALLLRRGLSPHQLWSILLTLITNMSAVYACVRDGIVQPSAIAARTGINPYALRALVPYVLTLKAEDIPRIVARAASNERALKAGLLRATDDAPQEILCAIDQLILCFP